MKKRFFSHPPPPPLSHCVSSAFPPPLPASISIQLQNL